MLELKEISVQIPNWVNLDEAIPGYRDMSSEDQSHYQSLYLLACYPELLHAETSEEVDSQGLPKHLPDLHALLYFIFHYNLAYRLIDETHISIKPALPVKWSYEDGLRMVMKDGLYAPLLEEISPLQSNPPIYFVAVMLSLALMRIAIDPATERYFLLMTLLVALLDGGYDQAMYCFIMERAPCLATPWLVNYLPAPASIVIDDLDKNGVNAVRKNLLGSITKRGMFIPARYDSMNSEHDEKNSGKKSFLSSMG